MPACARPWTPGCSSPTPSVALRHGLIGEIVYGTLVPAERRELHPRWRPALAARARPRRSSPTSGSAPACTTMRWRRRSTPGSTPERVYAFAEARTTSSARSSCGTPRRRIRSTTWSCSRAPLRRRATRATASGGHVRSPGARPSSTSGRARARRPPLRAAGRVRVVGRPRRARLLRAGARARAAGPSPDRARLLAAQGHALMGLRRWPEARDRCEAALRAPTTSKRPPPGSHSASCSPSSATPRPARRSVRDALRSASALGAAELAARAYVHLGELLRLRGAHADGARGDARGRADRGAPRHARHVRPLHVRQRRRRPAAVRPLGRGGGAAARGRAPGARGPRPPPCTTPPPAHAARAARRADVARAHVERAAELAAEGLPGEFVIPIRCAEAALALAGAATRRCAPPRRRGIARRRRRRDPLYTPALYCARLRAEAELPTPDPVRAERLLAELGRLLAVSGACPTRSRTGARPATPSATGRTPIAGQRPPRCGSALAEPYRPRTRGCARPRRCSPRVRTGARATTLLTAALATATALGAAPLRADVEALARRAHLRLGVVAERAAPERPRR